MKIKIEVRNYGDDQPFMPGTAYVYIDGEEYARLRTSESFEIEVKQEFVTLAHYPFKDEGDERTA